MSEIIHFYQGQKDLLDKIRKKTESSTGPDNNQEKEFIQQRIKSFMNMKNVNFLFGSGTSCPYIPNMSGIFKAITDSVEYEDKSVQDFFSNIAKGKNNNIEEILGILYSYRIYMTGVGENDKYESSDVAKLIKLIQRVIFDNVSKTPSGEVLDTYKRFYQKVAFRNKELARINVFTTNNDLFNETALDALNILYIDGFSGGLVRYFNPAIFNCTFSKRMDTSIERFEPVENMVYLYKIHGSVNWIEDKENSNTYFTIREKTEASNNHDETVLIYPTPIKQNKSLGAPYIDLFREFQHKLLEPNCVLFVIGYSFSDEHVNDIIYRALATNTSFNLVIMDNIDKDKPICKQHDNRIFRLFSEYVNDQQSKEENKEREQNYTPINYFCRIVSEVIPDMDHHSVYDDTLSLFVDKFRELNAKK